MRAGRGGRGLARGGPSVTTLFAVLTLTPVIRLLLALPGAHNLHGVPRAHGRGVRDDLDGDVELALELRQGLALVIEQEEGHVDGQSPANDRLVGGADGQLLKSTKDGQTRRLGPEHEARALTHRAGLVRAGDEPRLDALPGQLEQPELRDPPNLDAGLVELHGLGEGLLDLAAVPGAVHVDEVDHDEPAEIAQPQLARHLFGGLLVGLEGHVLWVVLSLGLARVDVDRDERLSGADDDRAAALQRHPRADDVLQLPLEPEVAEDRHLPAVELHLAELARHVPLEEVGDLLVHLRVVGDHLVDVVGVVVADRADDHVLLLVDEARLGALIEAVLDMTPDPHEVLEVSLHLLTRRAHTGRPHDDPDVVGRCELLDDLLQGLADVFVLNLATDAAALRARHEDEVPTRQRYLAGHGGALVAHLLFVGLHHHLTAALDAVLDAGPPVALGAARPETLVDVAKGDEAVALGAVVDEGGLQGRLHADDSRSVDVALDLLGAFGGDAEVFHDAAVDDGDPDLTRLCGVDQHSFTHDLRLLFVLSKEGSHRAHREALPSMRPTPGGFSIPEGCTYFVGGRLLAVTAESGSRRPKMECHGVSTMRARFSATSKRTWTWLRSVSHSRRSK